MEVTRLNVRFRPVEDISLDAARQSWPHHPMTNDRSGPDRMHGTLLLAAGCLTAAIVIGATLILPGMLSWSPGLLGLGATVGMALVIRRALLSRRYAGAWLVVATTPLLAGAGFAATYIWSYL